MMVLNRVISVGSAALVLAGALVLNTLVPFSSYSSQFSIQAQTAPAATTTGSLLVGPNEANVNPKITDKIAGIPVVVIIKATEPAANWEAEIRQFGAATPLVIRVADIDVNTVGTINWTQKGNELATVLIATGKQSSIVVFGNELNNLDREWRSRSAPTDASQVSDLEVLVAANAYGSAFIKFQAGMGSVGQVAPAPPDMSNPIYPWEEWAVHIKPIFTGASARVLNAYEVGGTVNEKISYFETKDGVTNYGQVAFLTEVGIDPAVTDLSAHIAFLNAYSGGPNGDIKAATLVPNHCQPGGWKNGGSVDDWLFYIKGQIFDRNGNLIDPTTCDANAVLVPTGKPVFLYPDPNMDITGFTNELDMYLANSQAYCAPPQIFWPTRPVTNETIVLQDGRVIDAENYPSVDITEDVSITSLSFPLFRSDAGGISVESDLSRVKAGETLADAISRNSRVDSAPQFYLSTPQTQCTTAARYVQYVKDLCEKDGFDVSDPANPELAKCGANLSVKMLDGEYRRITELLAADYLPNEAACENYTLEDVTISSPRAVAVQGISPYTPKVYKMGFYVQHTFLTGSQNIDLWHSSLRNASQIVAWFTGQEVSLGTVPEPQERVDVVPVWYHAGLTGSEFDQTQVQPYSIDLRDYSTDGTIQAKNFDPAARSEAQRAAQQAGVKVDPKISPVAEPLLNTQNYAGPLWRTYAFVLPQHVQENIALRKLQLVYQNYYLLQFMRANLGHNQTLLREELVNGIGADIITKLRLDKEKFWANEQFTLPFECSLGGGAVTDLAQQTCTQFRDTAYDPEVGYDGLPMAQTYEEIGATFPIPVLPAQKDQLNMLKKSLVARINAGVQITRAYKSKPADGELVGPLSVREIGAGCQVDQANIRRGIQETASDITSNALQPLQAPDDEPTDPPRNPITNLSNAITAWIYAGPFPAGDQNLTNRITSAYLILPDEAMGIETLQSYVSPLFLSPEMYQSIMTGKNPVYPFKEVWDDLMAGADASDQVKRKLSAFLRTEGPLRSVTGEDDGFVKAERQILTLVIQNNADGELRGCDGPGRAEQQVWLTIDQFDALEQPNPDNGCIGYREVERRTVGVTGNQPEKEPSMGVSVPGNTFAMGEFLRRLAFTPLHQQKNSVYTGLEDFYKSLGQSTSGGVDGGDDDGTDVVGAQCLYPAGAVYDAAKEPGIVIGDLESLRAVICPAARAQSTDPALIRALLEIEGSPYLRAVRNQGDAGGSKYTCQPNTAGAVGPMSRVIGQCAPPGSVTSTFFLEDNKTRPNICKLSGAIPATARHLLSIPVTASAGTPLYYAQKAEGYLGRGSCGDLTDPNDGAGKALVGNEIDYCAYVSKLASENFANYCN